MVALLLISTAATLKAASLTSPAESYVAHLQAFRAKAAADPQRPRFHFAPPAFWLNDPNGLIQWKGLYHLFYQYDTDQTTSTLFGGWKHWGHATSRDLLHWQHQPIALTPGATGPDRGGVWSGCVVNDHGVPTALYTGVTFNPFAETQCLATSRDDLQTWRKTEQNPVLTAEGIPLAMLSFRDPYVWQEGSGWYMALGSGLQNAGPAVLLFKSPNLRNWQYLHPLYQGAPADGVVFECPSFFSLDSRHVLTAKTQAAIYYSGHWAEGHFTPETSGNLDLFNGLTAPQVFIDARGRRILMAWVDEARSSDSIRTSGWSGLMSLPRVLSLDASAHVTVAPAEELTALRGAHQQFPAQALPPDKPFVFPAVHATCAEVRVRLTPQPAARCGIILRRSPDGAEQTILWYDAQQQQLTLDRTHSSLDPHVTRDMRTAPLKLAPGAPLELRLFLDGSIVEVFVNGSAAGSARIYPTRADSDSLALISTGGTTPVASVDVWQLK
jgi:beta-fructofuranosidase